MALVDTDDSMQIVVVSVRSRKNEAYCWGDGQDTKNTQPEIRHQMNVVEQIIRE